ncbi:FAD-dependent pyridine nucleotide-disulphide oxidoreductase [Thermocrinis albus DSM 14484]|uniref:FAD-dependent pyridine nucleotide-disulphide oxidoreductase n=1 Tax=Thermocrinis albus (strain DSM 14484 / JCM 11386 / HI 11/12) TaxID=638303 RepID=D3SPF3_THEAH|nr:NAD(P)/FAD-dependent oxidoreductase [Thermocrinis albus]ADC89040.1 FAD-dependent pyridine nucleotide-disulphide oxidoreductase [Thermocrinis albus DSM 14484]
MIKSYDVIVVGSGPGGFNVSLPLARAGLKVALVEGNLLGGTCLNRGCIPKEGMYRIAREVLSLRRKLGTKVKPDFMKALDYVRRRVEKIRENARFLLKREGVEFIEGYAYMVDEQTVKVSRNRYLKGKFLVLACGSLPLEEPSVEDVLTGKLVPKGKVMVVGSGASACELAFILSVFGFDTYLKVQDRLLKDYPVEEDIVEKLERELELCGVKITTTEVDADIRIMATGRRPGLHRELFPFLQMDEDGYVKVDDTMRTNLPYVYAVGDVTRPMGATHALAKARVACQAILGLETKYEPHRVPTVICSALELAFVGKGTKGKKYIKTFNANTKSYVNGWGGVVQLIVDEDGRLSHVTLLGVDVSEVINAVCPFIDNPLWYDRMYSMVFSHPSLCEIFTDFAQDVFLPRD